MTYVVSEAVEHVHCLKRNHEVKHVIVLAFPRWSSVLYYQAAILSTRPLSHVVPEDLLAPTAMSTIVEPAELNAFHKPNAVPIHACDGTRSGMEAMNGI